MSKKDKLLRMSKGTNEKLEQLKSVLNTYNEKVGLAILSQNAIIEEAIHYYHSVKIGKEVLDHSVEQMSEIVVNRMSLIIRKYMEELALGFNFGNKKIEMIEILIGANMMASGFPIDSVEKIKSNILRGQKLQKEFSKIKEELNDIDEDEDTENDDTDEENYFEYIEDDNDDVEDFE